MSGAAWIKFFPSDWLAGTVGLSALEKGVYITLLALIYDKGGPIRLNTRVLARRCETTPAAFMEALQTLLEDGKIVESNGEIFNKKAEKIIRDAEVRIEKARKGGLAKAGRKVEENQSGNSAQADAKQRPGAAQSVLDACSDAAIPEPEPEPEKKRASKLAPKDEGGQEGDDTLEEELRHAAGWFHTAKRLSHVKPIADLIDRGLSLHDDVIPTVRQLAPNVEHKTSWTYFVGPLEDILGRRNASDVNPVPSDKRRLSDTPQAPRVWIWKGTPQWDAWAKTRAKPWPTSEQPHPEGGRRAGWWFDAEWPPPSKEQAA